MAVVLDQVLAQTAQIKAGVDPAQEVIGGNLIFEVEGLKQPPLTAFLLPHHGQTPCQLCYVHIVRKRHCVGEFFNGIAELLAMVRSDSPQLRPARAGLGASRIHVTPHSLSVFGSDRDYRIHGTFYGDRLSIVKISFLEPAANPLGDTESVTAILFADRHRLAQK